MPNSLAVIHCNGKVRPQVSVTYQARMIKSKQNHHLKSSFHKIKGFQQQKWEEFKIKRQNFKLNTYIFLKNSSHHPDFTRHHGQGPLHSGLKQWTRM